VRRQLDDRMVIERMSDNYDGKAGRGKALTRCSSDWLVAVRKSYPQEPEAVFRQYREVGKPQHFIRPPRWRAAAGCAGS